MSQSDRIVTVSTIKEPLEYAERFVRRNLSSGVDHMIVFLDAKQPRVQQMLEAHPGVTVIRTDTDYWQGERPNVVVDRQMVNANLACVALTELPWVRWLFHIDADEALSFNRDALLAIDARAVRFRTLEAVARLKWPHHEPQLFKKVPTFAELHALAGLGMIESPEIHSLFRGHSLGKSGVKPADGVRFRIHTVYEEPEGEIESELPDDMYLLHYESCCLEDFADRWRDYQPDAAWMRPFKDNRIGAAVHLILHAPDIGEAERHRYLRDLFMNHVVDDLRPLRRFDLLVRKPFRTAKPRMLTAQQVRDMESAISDLLAVDKSGFRSSLLEGPKRAARTEP